MNEEKWKGIVGQIKDSFKVLSHENLKGEHENETTEELIFENPNGKMKLARYTKPRVLSEKTFYAGRGGTDVGIQKEYSETETVDSVKLFIEVSGEWKEIDVSVLG